MANLLTELDVSRSTDIDANSKAAAVRVFDTVLIDSAAVEQAFDNEVGRGPYPSNPALRFDRLSIVPNIRGSGHRVTAYYSTFGGGRFNTREKPEGYYYRWRYGNTKVEVEIPANVRERRVTGSGDTQTVKEMWVSVPIKVEEFRTVWTLSIYTEVSDIRRFDNITKQMDKLHTIKGRRVRFVNGSVRNDERRDGWYTCEYSWEVDTGTRKPNDGQTVFPPQFTIEEPINGSDPEFYRYPYETFVVIPSPDPENEPHRHYGLLTLATDPDGYLTLPGVRGDE